MLRLIYFTQIVILVLSTKVYGDCLELNYESDKQEIELQKVTFTFLSQTTLDDLARFYRRLGECYPNILLSQIKKINVRDSSYKEQINRVWPPNDNNERNKDKIKKDNLRYDNFLLTLNMLKQYAKENIENFEIMDDQNLLPVLYEDSAITINKGNVFKGGESPEKEIFIKLSIGLPRQYAEKIAQDLETEAGKRKGNSKVRPTMPLATFENIEQKPVTQSIDNCSVDPLTGDHFFQSIGWPTNKKYEFEVITNNGISNVLDLESAKLPETLGTKYNLKNYLVDYVKSPPQNPIGNTSLSNDEGHSLHVSYLIRGDGQSNNMPRLVTPGLESFSKTEIDTTVDELNNAVNNIEYEGKHFDIVNLSMRLGEIPCSEEDRRETNDDINFFRKKAKTYKERLFTMLNSGDPNRQPLFVISVNQFSNECTNYNSNFNNEIGAELMQWAVDELNINAIPVIAMSNRSGETPEPIGSIGNAYQNERILAIGAPGEGIVSLDYDASNKQYIWNKRCGSSQATAIVSRLAALWRKKYSNQTPLMTKLWLMATGDPVFKEETENFSNNEPRPPKLVSTINAYRFFNSDPNRVTVWKGEDKEEFDRIELFGKYIHFPKVNILKKDIVAITRVELNR